MSITAAMRDSTAEDLAHYFNNTAMEWQMTPTKKRLFLVSAVDGNHFHGTYLTREGEWKEKRLTLKSWWETLRILPLKPVSFNLSDGCCLWYPNLSRNLKKSFPWSTNSAVFYGGKKAEEVTTQQIGLRAFPDLYPMLFHMGPISVTEALKSDRKATLTEEGFIVSRNNQRLLFKRNCIGELEGEKIYLEPKSQVFSEFLVKTGVDPRTIFVREPKKVDPNRVVTDANEAKEVQSTKVRVAMAVNVNFYNGAVVLGEDTPAYYVMNAAGDFRTYVGLFPGRLHIMHGWKLYSHVNHPPGFKVEQ